ncbi:MAG: cytochrome C oxidase subunit IV family protein [Planctomycetota bacterium]
MSAHVLPVTTYLKVFATLMGLTALTVAVAFLDLGRLNTAMALTIACVKGLLVLLIFMHLKFSNRLNWIFVGAALAWLAILIGFTFSDFLTRGWLRIYG